MKTLLIDPKQLSERILAFLEVIDSNGGADAFAAGLPNDPTGNQAVAAGLVAMIIQCYEETESDDCSLDFALNSG